VGEGDATYAFDLLDIVLLVGIKFRMMKRRGIRHDEGWIERRVDLWFSSVGGAVGVRRKRAEYFM
jgi:hypothetical protein